MTAKHPHTSSSPHGRAALAASCLTVGLALALAGPQLVVSAAAFERPLAGYGPSERFSLDGEWLSRPQRHLKPRAIRALEGSSSTRGWSRAQVPGAWNATDASSASMRGAVAWYRKDFALPRLDRSSTWIVRFQSVNNRMQAWLNGRLIGSHTGAFLPFELVLPAKLLNRRGINRLVLRIDSHRRRGDLPGVNLWWNYGGILRPVELERVRGMGFSSVLVSPELSCPTCAAAITYRVTVRNYGPRAQAVRLTSTYGSLPVDVGAATIPAGGIYTFNAAAELPAPKLWSPRSPYLYGVRLTLSAAGSQTLATYSLRSGVRSIAVAPDGTLRLNGEVLNLRGVGLIEDSPDLGGALDEAHDLRLIAEAKELGAGAIRSQYPLDERLEELADESGILLWSEVPVDTVPPSLLASAAFRAKAVGELEQNVLANFNHPSIIVWSIANELPAEPDAGQIAYIAQAAHAAHALDPTRPVGLAVAAYPAAGCQAAAYAPLDVIGFNDYFGWYHGPNGELADRNGLSPYLDAIRACYPAKALFVTEFGAEANREGPPTEPGTYAFQQEFVKYHLEVFATKPWLAGAFYWALQEFRVRPGWGGGNPKPSPPMHTKGLVSFSGYRKPAYYEAQRIYRSTEQLHAPASG